MIPPFIPLQGRFIRLEPLTEGLRAAVAAAQDGDEAVWAIMASAGHGPHFDGWWATARAEQARGERLGYAIRRLEDDRVVGTTSYLALRPAARGVEIGATFIHPDARRGPVNPESKALMLAHAFDAGVIRVEFMVDVRNARSQAAVAKLGAQREGVLRQNRITWTGHMRDTAVYSILDKEWPAVREGLERRLAGI